MYRLTRSYKGIVIDAGHGGTDSGATGNGIVEKDLTLKIAQYIHNRLDDLGIKNVLIRNTDETINPTERVERVNNAYGTSGDVIVVSNHINAGGGDGAEIIYALRNNDTLSSLIATEIEKEGQNVRKYYQRRLPSDPSKDYYFMLRNTGNTESIIVEYGFLDSTSDDVNQLKNNYENYAEAVVRALVDYIGATYIPVVGSDYYVVQKGDSLWSIARKLNTSVAELKSLNNLTSNNLSIRQVLKTPSSNTENDNQITYTVVKGDSLYKIAQKFNVTVQDLINLNNLTSTNLSVGQVLKVKGTVPSKEETTYTVVKGDSLYAIANKYKVSVQDIIDANNLKSTALSVGQKLIIPTQITNDLYTVKSGDSLYKIANQYGVTVEDLKKENNLTNNNLSVGQVLKIPSTNNYQTYTVKSGDSLYSIARQYNTTVSDIQALNNLKSTALSVWPKINNSSKIKIS